MRDGEFSVYAFDEQGFYTKPRDHVHPHIAVTHAYVITVFAEALGQPTPARVIIEDGGGFCVFEWVRGIGVTFGNATDQPTRPQ